ncbi:MAG: enoyl-CoA hydratase/isomerase family protein [Aeromicrobium sp.]
MSPLFAPELLVEERGPIRLLTLNRPEVFNATNAAMHGALISVWRQLAEDRDARAVVITGAGKAFSAGGDFEHLASLWSDKAARRVEIDNAGRLLREMLEFPLPVVAAVNGPAVGLGCNLAICSDIVLIAESAHMADPHVGVGLTAADGGAPTWPMLMGMLKAKEYLLTSAPIPAKLAVELGLANRVVSDEAVLDEALAVAEKLAQQPAHAIQTTKRALNLHMKRAVQGVLEYALDAEYASFDTPEHQGIVTAFLERSRVKRNTVA